jgi:hypothetical protein
MDDDPSQSKSNTQFGRKSPNSNKHRQFVPVRANLTAQLHECDSPVLSKIHSSTEPKMEIRCDTVSSIDADSSRNPKFEGDAAFVKAALNTRKRLRRVRAVRRFLSSRLRREFAIERSLRSRSHCSCFSVETGRRGSESLSLPHAVLFTIELRRGRSTK